MKSILPSVVVYFGVNWAVKPGGWGYVVYFLLGMCRWPLRALTHYRLFCGQL